MDRLGRSLQDLVGFLTEVHALGINLFLHQQGVDTTTPAGKALFQMMGVFAEFERAMIQERVRAGLERARAQGKRLGRRPIDARKEAAIRADLREGKAGIMKLAAAHGGGRGDRAADLPRTGAQRCQATTCPPGVHRRKSILSDSGAHWRSFVGSG